MRLGDEIRRQGLGKRTFQGRNWAVRLARPRAGGAAGVQVVLSFDGALQVTRSCVVLGISSTCHGQEHRTLTAGCEEAVDSSCSGAILESGCDDAEPRPRPRPRRAGRFGATPSKRAKIPSSSAALMHSVSPSDSVSGAGCGACAWRSASMRTMRAHHITVTAGLFFS